MKGSTCRRRRTQVALFVHSFEGGGAERVAVLLANEFSSRELTTDLVVKSASGPYRQDVSPSVSVVELGGSLRSLPFRLYRYLRTQRPEVMFSFMTGFNVIASFIRSRRSPQSLVLSEQNSILLSLSQKPRWEKVAARLASKLYPRADAVIAISQFIRSELVGMDLSQDTVFVVSNPIDTNLMQDSTGTKPDHPFFDSGKPVLISIGSLTHQKDHMTLVRSIAELSRELEVRLLILGEGEKRGALENLIEELQLSEIVDLPGFKSPPWPWLATSDVLVMSSIYEGWGNVIAEALFLGVPVVSTDAPSGPREILDNGRYGRLVEVGNPTALAEAISETLKDPPSPGSLKRRALTWSVDRVADEYLRAAGYESAHRP